MKEKAEMTREELIALGWMKKPSDKMQEKPKNQLTAVEWLVDKLEIFATEEEMNIIEQAKEMEKEQKIEFACAVYDKYNFGPQEISFREECEQFKSE